MSLLQTLDIRNIILLVVAFTNFFFGLAIFFNNREKTKAKTLFAGIAYCVALWTFSIAFYRYTSNQEYAHLALKTLYFVPVFIPLLYVFFTHAYIRSDNLLYRYPWLRYVMLGSACMVALLAMLTDLFVVDVSIPLHGEKIIYFGSWYIIYVAYFIVMFAWGFLNLFNQYVHTKETLFKQQITYLFLGTFLSSTVAMISNLLLPWMGIFIVNWLGNVTTIFFVGFIFYAIAWHNLFNLKIIMTEVLTFILWILLLLKTLLSTTFQEQVVNLLFLIVALIVGIFIIRSFYAEVEVREKVEKMTVYLTRANARLRELDRQKTEFVSIASHELRSPISSIRGYASMLLEGSYGSVPNTFDEPLRRIVEAGRLMSLTIDDFLNVTRIEQGKMTYAHEPIDICALVTVTVTDLSGMAAKNGVALSSFCDQEHVVIFGDEGKLKQIMTNVIENAIKYSPNGSVAVHVSLAPDSEKVRVIVTDNGIGLTSSDIAQLFQKFFRASNANTVSVHGTGLGLYLVHEMVKAHGGRVWVESAGIGKGSTFYIELPLKHEASATPPV